MGEFVFLRPYWLFALGIVVLLWLYERRTGKKGNRWMRIIDRHLHGAVLENRTYKTTLPLYVTVVLTVTIVALAGPAWREQSVPSAVQQSATVFVLDVSRSMDARDIAPSRLNRAKLKITDMLRASRGGQFALVVYSDEAFPVTPLTDDIDTVEVLLRAVATDIMPGQGSRLEAGVYHAARLLEQAGHTRGTIIALTDSVAPDAVPVIAEYISGYAFGILGIGTIDGAPIPNTTGGFLLDSRGAPVVVALEEGTLRTAAQAAGGLYVAGTNDRSDIERLATLFLGDAGSFIEDGTTITQLHDDGIWLVVLLLPLIMRLFRRGVFVVLAVPLALPPMPVHADMLGWLATPDRQGQQLFDRGDYVHAADTFRDSRWQAAAYFRAGDYEAALAALAGLTDADSLYNQGNALAKLGRVQEAIARYNQALAHAPDMHDAVINRDRLQEWLDKQQAQQEQTQHGAQQDSRPQHDRQQGQETTQTQSEENQSSAPDTAQSQHSDASNTKDGASQQQSTEHTQTREDNVTANDAKAAAEKTDTDSTAETDNNVQDASRDENTADAAVPQNDMTAQQEARALAEQRDEHVDNASDEDSVQHTIAPDAIPSPESVEAALRRKQWLGRVPDDPGGLLRRKFLYQYRKSDTNQSQNAW